MTCCFMSEYCVCTWLGMIDFVNCIEVLYDVQALRWGHDSIAQDCESDGHQDV